MASGVTFTVSSQVNGTVVNGSAATTFTGTQLAANQVTFTHNGSETTSASFQVSVEDGKRRRLGADGRVLNFTATPVDANDHECKPTGGGVEQWLVKYSGLHLTANHNLINGLADSEGVRAIPCS